MPNSTLPSNGTLASYWAWTFMNSWIHGFEVSVLDGR
jgi:hypothetical protein